MALKKPVLYPTADDRLLHSGKVVKTTVSENYDKTEKLSEKVSELPTTPVITSSLELEIVGGDKKTTVEYKRKVYDKDSIGKLKNNLSGRKSRLEKYKRNGSSEKTIKRQEAAIRELEQQLINLTK